MGAFVCGGILCDKMTDQLLSIGRSLLLNTGVRKSKKDDHFKGPNGPGRVRTAFSELRWLDDADEK